MNKGELINPVDPRSIKFPLFSVTRLSGPIEWATELDAGMHIDTGSNPIRLAGEAIDGPDSAPRPTTQQEKDAIISTSDQWNEGE